MSDRPKRTFVLLRYLLGGDRPSQTAYHARSPIQDSLTKVRTSNKSGWYFKDDSTETSVPVSQSPTYPTQTGSKSNAKLQ